MYILCGNCGYAQDEFYELHKESSYFGKACGENELDDGGVMLKRCKETCDGKKPKDEEDKEPEKIEDLEVRKLILSPEEDVSIDYEDDQEIKLKKGGEYQLELISFNKTSLRFLSATQCKSIQIFR